MSITAIDGISFARHVLAVAAVTATALLSVCTMADPEAVIVNNIGPHVLVRNPSFNGTVWNTVLRHGEATPPSRCLSGDGTVHFQLLDAHYYCRRQSEYQLIDSICMCDSSWVSGDTDVITATPVWFNYKTIKPARSTYGTFQVIELTAEDMEQDFSVPGPYGH
jgi:hypothetical protein